MCASQQPCCLTGSLSVKQLSSQLASQPVSQSANQVVSKSFVHSVSQSVGCSVCRSVSLWVSRPAIQLVCVSQVVSQTVSWSVSQSIEDRNLPFLRMLKKACVTDSSDNGSSVMKRTRSRLTLANTSRSVKSSAQNGLTARPSTRLRSPPNIHWRPGELSTNGWIYTGKVVT